MYSRNRDTRPSRPVITSLLSAMSEIERWMDENRFREIKDADGQMWQISMEVKQIPDTRDTHGLLWQATVRLAADVDAETFIDNGVLDRVADQRLISLIGDRKIPLSLKPAVYTATSEDEMRQIVASVMPKLKAHFAKNSFYDVKRQLIGRFIDETCRFGYPPGIQDK